MNGNVVVYADNGRTPPQPLGSFDGNDPLLALHVGNEIMTEMNDAEKRGQPHPSFHVVLETRTANEGGQQTSAVFTPLHPVSLQPQSAPLFSLKDVFARLFKPAAPAADTQQAAQ